MIFVTCLWRKILKYINSSCFSVQIPDNWKLIAVFSVLSKLSYKNPVGEMIQMDLSSPDQHDTVCSGTAGTVRPVTRRDPAVLIKLFLTSAHMTWRLATCPVTSTLHVGCNTHITVTGRSDSVTGAVNKPAAGTTMISVTCRDILQSHRQYTVCVHTDDSWLSAQTRGQKTSLSPANHSPSFSRGHWRFSAQRPAVHHTSSPSHDTMMTWSTSPPVLHWVLLSR